MQSSLTLICQMRHPTYALNPGDMFSITPKKVLWGTGAPQFYLGTPEKAKKIHQKAHQLVGSIRTEVRKASKADEAEAEQAAAEAEADAEEEAAAPEDELAEEERAAKKTLKDLRKQALSMLEEKKKDLSSKQKQLLRALRTEIPKMMSRKQFSAPDLAAAQQRFTDATDLSRSKEDEAAKEPPVSTFTETEIANAASLLKDLRTQIQYLIEHWRRHDVEAKTRYELRKFWVAAGIMLEKTGLTRPDYADAIKKHVASIAEKHKVRMDDLRQWAEMEYRPKEYDLPNPYEPEEGQPAAEDAKPVINTFKGLPWRPRPYMSAFAFIPRYLEVNQNVCSAVYLRHPVVRPGLAEVPTPFPEGLNQLAFNWYLRRR